MPTIFDAPARNRLLERIEALKPDRRPLWGRFTAAQMVCHAADQLRNGLGEVEVKPVRRAVARPPLNWLIIHVLPLPKGKAQSPPEMLRRTPVTWEQDVLTLKDAVRRFGERGPDAEWPDSPVFGRISPKSWGVLAYKHLDHHLRQFGV